jgi:ABC-type multidrug transport system fused ATPase/permease subunit
VYVTHHLAGLDGVDEVIVLEGGRVAARGRHDDLVAAGGDYARRYERDLSLRAGGPAAPAGGEISGPTS